MLKATEIRAALAELKVQQAALADQRAKAQEALHAKLDETQGAEGHPDVIALRGVIETIQREKFAVDMALSEATKATRPAGVTVLSAEDAPTA